MRPLEELAGGFRWIEGPVVDGRRRLLLFQDLPAIAPCAGSRGRDFGLSLAVGLRQWSVPRPPGTLISCSHRERCLFRTELDAP